MIQLKYFSAYVVLNYIGDDTCTPSTKDILQIDPQRISPIPTEAGLFLRIYKFNCHCCRWNSTNSKFGWPSIYIFICKVLSTDKTWYGSTTLKIIQRRTILYFEFISWFCDQFWNKILFPHSNLKCFWYLDNNLFCPSPLSILFQQVKSSDSIKIEAVNIYIAINNYDHYNTSILYEQSTIKSLTVIPQHKGHIIDSLPITDTNCCCQWRLHLKATTITT